jgi:hypothetical protein
MFNSKLRTAISVLLLGVMTSTVFAATATVITSWGNPCAPGSKLARPYSNTYINDDTGDVTHVEHIDCNGDCTTGVPSSVIIHKYSAYGSFLYTDNTPTVSFAGGGGIFVSLTTAAKIEVRDAYTGSLIISLPSSGPELSSYTVSSGTLTSYIGKLLVVDVIRTSDNSYRGTKSIVYTP